MCIRDRYLQRTPAMLAALLGTLRAGAAYLPMDPYFPAERLRFMLDDAGTKLVLSDGQDAGLQLPPARVLSLDDALSASDASVPSVAVDRDALAYLIYTSGSVSYTHLDVCKRQVAGSAGQRRCDDSARRPHRPAAGRA